MKNNSLIASQIVGLFEGFKMAPANTEVDQWGQKGKDVMTSKIESAVSNNKPVEFVMLGYPFKSTNTMTKVLGVTPDRNEKESIDRIIQFTKKIETVYSPGAKFNIASDGYAFNDLLEVSDMTVEQYKELCLALRTSNAFNILDMKDFYPSLSIGREKVMGQFGITDEELEQKILFDINTNWLYRGMIRFMEEELMMKDFPSRNQRHIAAKKLTKQMMLRNEAWSNLVNHEFSDNIRLSMHQTINDGKKFSFDLIEGAKHSPWHSVLVDDGGIITTMHKKDAIEQGFILNKDHYARA